jgi:hypothetical protein
MEVIFSVKEAFSWAQDNPLVSSSMNRIPVKSPYNWDRHRHGFRYPNFTGGIWNQPDLNRIAENVMRPYAFTGSECSIEDEELFSYSMTERNPFSKFS